MEKLRKNSWMFLFGVGLFFLALAWYWGITVPALEPDDPERGWAWLTLDPEIIEYIKFYFKMIGLFTFGFSLFILVTASTTYRSGQRGAWWCMAYLPVHIILLSTFMPWLWPLYLLLLILSIAGLALPFRQFFPN